MITSENIIEKENEILMESSNPPTLLSLAKIWLTEWSELEKKKRVGNGLSRLYFTYAKALDSVKKSKEEDVKTIEDISKLKGIGAFILGKFKRQLLEYQTKTGHIIVENSEINITNEKKSKTKKDATDKPKRKVKKKKEYVPAYRSGSYAILISLYECTSNSSMNESMLEPFLTKAEIIRHGQQYCSSSFTVPLNGTHFTAWSSMSELTRRELVGKVGSPPKYYLTDEGVELAKRLVDAMEKLGPPPNTSEIVSPDRIQSINNKEKEKEEEEKEENPLINSASKDNNNKSNNKKNESDNDNDNNDNNNNNSNNNNNNNNDNKILGSSKDLVGKVTDLNQIYLLNEIAKNLSLINQKIEESNLLFKESEKDLSRNLINKSNFLISETRQSLKQLFNKNTNFVLDSSKNSTSTSTSTSTTTTAKKGIYFQSKLPIATRYLINDDDDFEVRGNSNSKYSRLNVFNEKYSFVKTNGKSMDYLSRHNPLFQTKSHSELNSSKPLDSYFNLNTKKTNNVNKTTSSKESVMFKTVTKPFLSKSGKDKGKESIDNQTSFKYFYLNDEDEAVYDKEQAFTKYENGKHYYKVYYLKKLKDHSYTKHIINKMSFGGYIIGFMEDTFALTRASGFSNEKDKEILNKDDNTINADNIKVVKDSSDKSNLIANNDIKNIMDLTDASISNSILFEHNSEVFINKPKICPTSADFELFNMEVENDNDCKNASYKLMDKTISDKSDISPLSESSISYIFENPENHQSLESKDKLSIGFDPSISTLIPSKSLSNKCLPIEEPITASSNSVNINNNNGDIKSDNNSNNNSNNGSDKNITQREHNMIISPNEMNDNNKDEDEGNNNNKNDKVCNGESKDKSINNNNPIIEFENSKNTNGKLISGDIEYKNQEQNNINLLSNKSLVINVTGKKENKKKQEYAYNNERLFKEIRDLSFCSNNSAIEISDQSIHLTQNNEINSDEEVEAKEEKMEEKTQEDKTEKYGIVLTEKVRNEIEVTNNNDEYHVSNTNNKDYSPNKRLNDSGLMDTSFLNNAIQTMRSIPLTPTTKYPRIINLDSSSSEDESDNENSIRKDKKSILIDPIVIDGDSMEIEYSQQKHLISPTPLPGSNNSNVCYLTPIKYNRENEIIDTPINEEENQYEKEENNRNEDIQLSHLSSSNNAFISDKETMLNQNNHINLSQNDYNTPKNRLTRLLLNRDNDFNFNLHNIKPTMESTPYSKESQTQQDINEEQNSFIHSNTEIDSNREEKEEELQFNKDDKIQNEKNNVKSDHFNDNYEYEYLLESSPIKKNLSNILFTQEVSKKFSNIEDDFAIKNLNPDEEANNDNIENEDSNLSNSSENKRKKNIETLLEKNDKDVDNNNNEDFQSFLLLKKRKINNDFDFYSSQEDNHEIVNMDGLKNSNKNEITPIESNGNKIKKDNSTAIESSENKNLNNNNLNNNISFDYNDFDYGNFDYNCNFDCDIDYDNCYSENLKSEFYCGHNNNAILLDDDEKSNIVLPIEKEDYNVDTAINNQESELKDDDENDNFNNYNNCEDELVIRNKKNNDACHHYARKLNATNSSSEATNINNVSYEKGNESEFNNHNDPFEFNKNTPPSSLPPPTTSLSQKNNIKNISSLVESNYLLEENVNDNYGIENDFNTQENNQVFDVENDNIDDYEWDTNLVEEEILLQTQSQKDMEENIFVPSISQRIVLQPDEYEIILILDNREVSSKTDRNYIQDNLALRGINCDTRPLVLGDVTWIAKEKKPNGIEVVLDHIIERKRIDDLISSIKDGRFREQKNRLKNCGINDIIYLVEGTKTKQSELFGADRIMSALCSTQIYNSFFIKRTSNIEETMNYFSIITKSLKMKYKNQPIFAYSFKRNTLKELPTVRNILNQRDQCFYHLTYDYFSSINSKTQSLTISNIWATWLQCIRGVSSDKANTIIYKYPTFSLFMESFKKCKTVYEIEEFFSNMVTEDIPKRKRITKVMAKKLYNLYCSENYSQL
ncbi:hypothetical protein BCR36DRAFT_408895 [Piromyces finnis]|uniref:Crossover junction endonuclease MUS81 n=1 Tax=Piromyces finnis TaxID=1754191 RepID=A0A1Y1VLL2_9FUNG|nr:hypothetical protein BCR36DRAFT_408895 [Piromyces finnis]|eukprot:ORX58377.1 hypothetical protein BCR36DRAFT_408895 [Piromyces finnis]